MKRLTASELFKREIKPFLYGAFLNRIMVTNLPEGQCFYAYTSFRASKAIYRDDFNFVEYADSLLASLNHFSGFYNWEKYNVKPQSMELRFYVINDLNITSTQFYSLLYKKMLNSDWLFGEELNDEKKAFIIVQIL